jgi:tripartite ATP-independent transporter DctP family solute receptor
MVLVILSLPIFVGLTGCSQKAGNGKPATNQKLVYRLGHALPTDNPRHLAAVRFGDLVKERTGGRVEVTVYPSGQLGGEQQLAEAVKMGSLDFTANGPVFANYVPQYAVFGLPFLFKSYDEAYTAIDGPLGQKMNQLAREKGLFILSIWDSGFRQITTNGKPIAKPGDLKGLKLRTPEEFVNVETFKALGCNVVAMPFTELYLALKQHVVDGQENPLANIYYSKLYEVQKYLTITNHIYANSLLFTSLDTWNKIPKDVQEVMIGAAAESKIMMRKSIQEGDKQFLDELKAKGMIVNTPNIAPFREASRVVYKTLEDRIGKDVIEMAVKSTAK